MSAQVPEVCSNSSALFRTCHIQIPSIASDSVFAYHYGPRNSRWVVTWTVRRLASPAEGFQLSEPTSKLPGASCEARVCDPRRYAAHAGPGKLLAGKMAFGNGASIYCAEGCGPAACTCYALRGSLVCSIGWSTRDLWTLMLPRSVAKPPCPSGP